MGIFITFEGIDGSGKTTQIKLLKEKVEEHEIDTVFVREPGSTAIGEKIREVLLSPESREMSMTSEVFLYAAARAQLVREIIIPGLSAGKTIICDRFTDSTIAYQGFGSGYDLESIHLLNREATGGTMPELTFVMDIEVTESLNRCKIKNEARGEADRIEERDAAYYERVRRGYLEIAAENPDRIVRIPSKLTIEEVHNIIWEKINGRLTRGF